MKEVHIAIGVLALALNVVAAVWGGWFWWRGQPSAWFWRWLRAGQAAVVLEIVLGGILVAIGRKAVELHYVYGVLPVIVAVIAEQLRLSAAQMVLDQRGLESAQAVGTLPRAEQQALVLSIVRREMGVMALAAFVTVVLLARAATVVH